MHSRQSVDVSPISEQVPDVFYLNNVVSRSLVLLASIIAHGVRIVVLLTRRENVGRRGWAEENRKKRKMWKNLVLEIIQHNRII